MESLVERAKAYATSRQITVRLDSPLGFGTDGSVWRTDRDTAVKVFQRELNYRMELGSYRRLSDHDITEIDIFTIPTLIGSDDELLVVEISIVTPPFLLDFGKVDLDERTEFSPEVLAETEQQCVEYFGERWPTVKSAIYRLERYGIYYLDIRPGNVLFGDER